MCSARLLVFVALLGVVRSTQAAGDNLMLAELSDSFGCPFGGRIAHCGQRTGCFLHCNPWNQDSPSDACDPKNRKLCNLLPYGWTFCVTEEKCGVDGDGADLVGGYAPHVATSASVKRNNLRVRPRLEGVIVKGTDKDD